MSFLEILRQTAATFRAHKMRSFLTMFGIVWGIASVILLVGLGRGFNIDQRKRMETLGKDIVIIWGGRTSAQAGGLAAGRGINMTIEDVEVIKSECYLVKQVSPELRRDIPEVSAFNAARRTLTGVWPSFQDFRSLTIAEGRLITETDEEEANRVVVLGAAARQQLFSGKPAIDQQLTIKGVPYTVIGVLSKKEQSGNYAGPDDDALFAPYSAVARDFPKPEKPGIVRGYVDDIVFQVADPNLHEETIRQVRRVLARGHHFDVDDKDAFFVWDTMRAARLVQHIFDVVTIFFGAVAVVTLCLGGIGVMNIMLVSVSERTREIGVRKAMGATRGDILKQFFAESVVLTAVSGTLGLAAGIILCAVMANVPLPDFVPHPIVSATSIVVSVVTLSLITCTAGVYPAQRAAEMAPVDSLRYE